MTCIQASNRVAYVIIDIGPGCFVAMLEWTWSAEIIANKRQKRVEPKLVNIDIVLFVRLLLSATAARRVDLVQPTASVLVLLVFPHRPNAFLEESQIAHLVHHRRRVHMSEHRPKVLDVCDVDDLFNVLGPVARLHVAYVAERPRVIQGPLSRRVQAIDGGHETPIVVEFVREVLLVDAVVDERTLLAVFLLLLLWLLQLVVWLRICLLARFIVRFGR